MAVDSSLPQMGGCLRHCSRSTSKCAHCLSMSHAQCRWKKGLAGHIHSHSTRVFRIRGRVSLCLHLCCDLAASDQFLLFPWFFVCTQESPRTKVSIYVHSMVMAVTDSPASDRFALFWCILPPCAVCSAVNLSSNAGPACAGHCAPHPALCDLVRRVQCQKAAQSCWAHALGREASDGGTRLNSCGHVSSRCCQGVPWLEVQWIKGASSLSQNVVPWFTCCLEEGTRSYTPYVLRAGTGFSCTVHVQLN